MMKTIYRDPNQKDVTKDVQVDYQKLAASGQIDLAKLTALFLTVALSDDVEAKDAFNAAMYQFALYMQCEGTVRFTSSRYRTIATANNELIAMLRPDGYTPDRDMDPQYLF